MFFPRPALELAAVMAGTIAVVGAQRYNLVDHYDASNWLNMFSVQSVHALLSQLDLCSTLDLATDADPDCN